MDMIKIRAKIFLLKEKNIKEGKRRKKKFYLFIWDDNHYFIGKRILF